MVDVSVDGGASWTPLRGELGSAPSGSSGGWVMSVLDLSSFAGETIQIRYYFDTIDNIANDYPGWFFDDVLVTASGVPWLTVSPETGTVAPGSSVYVQVAFDATGLFGGDYQANIIVTSNDPVTPEVVRPVSLSVTGAPDIIASTDTLDFGQVFVNYADTLELVLKNNGTDDLLISSAATEPSEYTVSPTFAGIDPGEIEIFTVTFAPTALIDYPGTLTFTSNDPDEGTYVVVLLGQGVEPPVISVSPDSLSEALFTGGTSVQYLTIDNSTGGSDLIFDILVVSTDAFGMSANASFASAPQDGGRIFRKPGRTIHNQVSIESSGKSAFSEGQSSFHNHPSETIGRPSANAAEATNNLDMSNWSQSQVGAADRDISLNSTSHRQESQNDSPALITTNKPRVLLLTNNGPEWDFTELATSALISTGIFVDSDIDILNDPLSISLTELTPYDA